MQRQLRSNSNAPNIWPINQINLNNMAAPAPTTEWKMNLLHGNFNPGTRRRQQIFLEKTKGLADGTQFDLTKDNSAGIHQFFKARAASLGSCILIHIAFDATGMATSKATNLITQHSKISLEHIQHEAIKRFSAAVTAPTALPAPPFTVCAIDPSAHDPDKVTLYDRVNASVLVKFIENVLSTLGFQDLLLQHDAFTFTDATSGEVHFDGPTMLKLILTQIDPDMIVGMDSLKAQLESMKLHDFGNDVGKMLTKMQGIYQTLKENGHTLDSY